MNCLIHSLESFGTVDGPGVRFVVFLQGCPLRCLYCHNPDSWETTSENVISIDEILEKYNSNRAFYKDGGITVSGGEPLMQIEFVTELFKRCKEQNIHTCLDTSGITFSQKNKLKFDELFNVTDLIMLDIKHIDTHKHKELTGLPNENILDFLRYTSTKNQSVWIRHVIIPGYTLNHDYLAKLGYFLGEFRNIKAIDALPFHKLGNSKYSKLNISDPLENTPEATKEEAFHAKRIILHNLALRAYEIKNNL